MSSQEYRSSSLKIQHQQTSLKDLHNQGSTKRIRINDGLSQNSLNISKTQLSLTLQTSQANNSINYQKNNNNIPSPKNIHPPPLDKLQKTQQRFKNNYSVKGLHFSHSTRDAFYQPNSFDTAAHSYNNIPFPQIKEGGNSKQIIENNNNVISQLVQSCKKFHINSVNQQNCTSIDIPSQHQSGNSSKMVQIPETMNQLFHSNQKINHPSTTNILQNNSDSKNLILNNNHNVNSSVNNQLHNATILQQSSLMKEKLSSLQGLCSPAILSSKKKNTPNNQQDSYDGKVESAVISSFTSKPEDSYLQLLKKQNSETPLKSINRESPLRVSIGTQNSFFKRSSNIINSNSMNKSQIKDSQTYSSADKTINGVKSSVLNSTGKQRATVQEFFTKRIINLQKSIVKVNSDDMITDFTNQNIPSKKTQNSIVQIENKSHSIIQFPKLDDISKFLQTSVTSAFSEAPRSRADLKEMIKWFEKVKKQNEDENKYNNDEKRKKQQEIIQVCFKELSHQIRIDFIERDQFFQMVWNENNNYYKSFIEDFEQIKLKLNTAADSEYNRVSDFYKQYIKTKDTIAEQAFQEKINVEKQLAQAKENLQENQVIHQALKHEINKFKKICMFMKKKLVTMSKEMEGLISRKEDRTRYNKSQMLSEFYKEQLQKFKSEGLVNPSQQDQTIQSLMEQLRLANETIAEQQKQNQDKEQQIDKMNSQNASQMHQEGITKNKDNEDDEDDELEDDNFTFEYQEGGDLIQGVDQLNAVIVNTEQEVKRECIETQVDDELRQRYMRDIPIQTDLYLVNHKYDALMFDVDTMNDIFDFYTYKQQMDEQVEKFDPHAFLQTLNTEQDPQENNNFLNAVNQIKSMISIQEEDKKSGKSSSSSDSDSDSDSSSSGDESNKNKQQQKKNNKTKTTSSKNITLQPNNNFLSVKKDYDNLKGFQQRRSIRQRVSIRQNIFNSNRHLGLYLEQYLGNNFVNEILAIFSDKINQNQESFSQQQISLQPPAQQTDNMPAISLDVPKINTFGQRLSFLNAVETNPFIQMKRNQIKKKLTEILEADKIKQVLDDAGLKVTSTETESKLEKFVKIYQLSQIKGQELQLQLQKTKSMLESQTTDLQANLVQLANKEILTEEQKAEIVRLEEQIKELQAELELKIAHEKELLKMQKQKGTLTNLDDNEGQPIRQKQPRIFKPRREKREVTAFQLGKKVNIEWEFQKQQNSGKQIVEKAKNKKMAKFHNFMTVKTILKQITQLYSERMNICKENSNYKDIEFSNFVYNYYSSQYGVKKIADQKFLILILSVKKYTQIVRINMFGKFLGLSEGQMNYSREELNKYIEILDFVNNISQAGTNYTNNESEHKYLVPYIKAVHYISQFGDTRMKAEENQELRRDVEGMKFMDQNKVAVVDFDQYMYRMLAAYRILINRAKQYVINAFNACDLDGNCKCNFNEWSLLNRHIEPDQFDDDQLIQIFEDNADIIEEDGEKNLSFDKFAVVSLEYQLFSDESQDRYLEITNPLQIRIKYEALMQIWINKKEELEERIHQLQNIEQETKEEWLNICSVLNDKLITVPFSNSNVKPLLIAYNILDKETHMLQQDNAEYIKSRSQLIQSQQDIQSQ